MTRASTSVAPLRQLALAAALVLAGCALKSPPDSKALTDSDLAHSLPPAAWIAGGAQGALLASWLASFDDPRLPALAEEALAYNQDLRVAAARVEAAAASAKAAGGTLYPVVDVIGRTSGDGTGGSGQVSGLLVNASWEIDLWGRVRYGSAAADAQYESVDFDRRFAQQSIVGTLAKAWFLAAESQLQQGLAIDMVSAAERLLQFALDRQRIGVGPEIDVAQARANLQTYRDRAAQIDLALAQSRRALEMLLGRYPAAEIALPVDLVALPAPPPTGLPSELLERRPDVVAAQRRVAASFARVGEAGAARLPRLSLTAALSSISSSVFVLNEESGGTTVGLGATVFYPLFNGGQLKAQVELRSAEQKQAAATFAQVAQRAFNEVETALANEASLLSREAILQQGLTHSLRALELEQVRYRIGSRDLRSVTQQQLVTYSARLSLLRVQTEQRVQRVQLHLALGGDFIAPAGS